MTKNPCAEIELDSPGSYDSIKKAVKMKKSYEWILKYLKPAGQPEYIMKDLWDRAVQESWEETELLKSDMGQLLYV